MHAVLLVSVMALTTMMLRFLPFLIWGRGKAPDFILYLGRVLPPAIIGMLVVYCLKDTSFAAPVFALPEVLACALVIALQAWRHNSLVSILAGTAAYMCLIHVL